MFLKPPDTRNKSLGKTVQELTSIAVKGLSKLKRKRKTSFTAISWFYFLPGLLKTIGVFSSLHCNINTSVLSSIFTGWNKLPLLFTSPLEVTYFTHFSEWHFLFNDEEFSDMKESISEVGLETHNFLPMSPTSPL